MNLTILSLLYMGLAIVSAEDSCQDNPFVVGCFDYPYMAKVTCAADACQCANLPEDGSEDICVGIQVADITAADLNGEKCKDICEATDKCVFYRWDKEGSINSQCLLMRDDECKGFLTCNKEHCLSGQAHCDGGAVTPVPDDTNCHALVIFEKDAVHWQCFYLEDLERHINIYMDEEVPTGVICVTAHKCKDWDTSPADDPATDPYYNDLVVQCNPDRETEEAKVLWGQYKGSTNEVTNDVIDQTTNQLKDPKCGIIWEPLILDAKKLHEPGVSFICEDAYKTEGDDVTIDAPNTCALLCNFHPSLTIENELAADGSAVWKKYDTGSNVGQDVVKDDIKCWDFMKI